VQGTPVPPSFLLSPLQIPPPPTSTLFPYTTLFRSLLTLRNALQHLDLASENVRLKAEVHAQYEIVGTSRAVKQVIERIEKVEVRSEEHTSELQSREKLVCRLLLEEKNLDGARRRPG